MEKTSFSLLKLRPKRPLNRREAILCLIVNVAACPGAGTFYARRWDGVPQLVLAFSGFGLFVGVFLWFLVRIFSDLQAPSFEGEPMVWIKRALLMFGTAWLWSAVSGLLLFRDTLPLFEKKA
jgi:hypothetical protein